MKSPSDMPGALKQIPEFDDEEAEREFWAAHDSTDSVDWMKARNVALPRLKPTTRTISLRVPESMLNDLKVLANKRDVPYQSLIKIILQERIDSEQRRYAASGPV